MAIRAGHTDLSRFQGLAQTIEYNSLKFR
jgi:hypothetical protein